MGFLILSGLFGAILAALASAWAGLGWAGIALAYGIGGILGLSAAACRLGLAARFPPDQADSPTGDAARAGRGL